MRLVQIDPALQPATVMPQGLRRANDTLRLS